MPRPSAYNDALQEAHSLLCVLFPLTRTHMHPRTHVHTSTPACIVQIIKVHTSQIYVAKSHKNTLGATTASCVGQHSSTVFCKTISLQQLHKLSARSLANTHQQKTPQVKLARHCWRLKSSRAENNFYYIFCSWKRNKHRVEIVL